MKNKIISIKLALPTLSAQITQACNFSCLHCDFQRNSPEATNQRPLHMPVVFFVDILKQYRQYPQSTPKNITLSAGGEPMMHPNFLEICNHVDNAGITFGFDTNASKLNEHTAKMLLSFSQFKRIVFSVDGFSPSVYESIRRGGNFDIVIGNILNFLALAKNYGRNDITTRVNMVLQEINKHEANKMIEYWTPRVSQVNISNLRKGTQFINPNWLPENRKPCDFLRNFMRILTDGTVVVCCLDDQYVSIVGNIKDTSLEEVWNGEAYQKLRAAHDSGNYSCLPICKDCNAWAGFYPARETKPFSPTITIGIRPANIIAYRN